MDQDVPPIVTELQRIDPDVITVAFDPEASGPDTHYKVMQALAEAIRVHLDRTSKPDLKIWGYRNVWFRFDPSEANLFVPTTMSMFSFPCFPFFPLSLSSMSIGQPCNRHILMVSRKDLGPGAESR